MPKPSNLTRRSWVIASRLAWVAVVLLAWPAATAEAQTRRTWSGAVDTLWTTGSNWFGNAAPSGSSDTIVLDSTGMFATGTSVLLPNSALTVASIVFTNPATDVVISGTSQNNGDFVVNGAGIDMSNATRNLSITANRWLYVNGTINVASGRTLTLNWLSPTAGGGVNSGTATINGAGNVVFSKGVNVSAGSGLNIASGSTNMQGLTLNGNVRFSDAILVMPYNTGFVLNSGTFIQQSGTTFISETNNRWTGNSSITINGGIFTQPSNWRGTTGVANNANDNVTLTFAGGTSTLYALPAPRGAGASLNVNFNGGVFRPAATSTVFFGTTAASANLYAGNNGALIDTNTFNLTLAQPIMNGTAAGTVGFLTKLGSGTLTLSALNSYSGNTRINAGALSLGSADALAASTLDMNSGDAGSLVFGLTGTNTYNIGGLIGSRNIATSGSAVMSVGANATSGTYSGVLSGGGAFTKVGAGTLTLSNANTYTGTTTIAAGALQVGDGGSAGALNTSSVITGPAGGTLIFNRSDNVSQGSQFANGITGGIGLSKIASGTLTLSSSNSYTGGTVLSAGQLNINHLNALGTGTFSISGGAIDNSSAAAITLATNNPQAWNADFTFVGTKDLNLGTGAVTLSGDRQVTTTAGTLTAGGPIGGVFGLRKAGNGTLALSGANTYSGQTRVSAGVLALGASNAISDQSSLLVDGGGFNLGGFNESVNAVTLTSGSIFGSGTLTSTSAYDVSAGTVSAILSGSVGLTKSTSGTVTLSGANTYTGATQVTAGLLRVDVANAISSSSAITLGGLTTRGFLEIDAPLTISSLTFSGSGGDIVDTSQGTATFSATSGTALISVGSGSNVFHAAATLASPTLLDVSSGAFFTFHNNISGSATFTKQGLGTLNIVGDNDGYSGSFLITGGRVNIGAGMNQIGTGTTTLSGGATLDLGGQAFTDRVIVLSGTILNAGGTATTTTISGPATISGSTVGTYNITSTGIGTFQAAIGNGSVPVNVNVSSTSAPGGQAIFNDVVAGQGNVTVYGGGTATFNAAVSGFTITHGVSTFNAAYNTEAQVQNGGSATFAGTTGASSMIKVFAGGAGTFSSSVTGTVQVGGTAEFTSASSLTGSLTTNAGGVATFTNMGATVASAIHNDGQLIVNRTSGSQTISGVINGSGSLVKQGAGALLLTGSNLYSGPTTISGGRLTVESAGSLNGTSGISVNGAEFKYNSAATLAAAITFDGSGGTLSGTGTIGSALTVGSNAILSPGNSPGAQVFTGGLTWAPGGTYVWELRSLSGTPGTDWDLLNVSGGTFDISSLSTENRFNLNLVTLNGSNSPGPLDSGYVAGSSYEFPIASFATLGSGTYAFGPNSDVTGLFAINLTGWQGPQPSLGDMSVRVNSAGNAIQLVIVPEPGSTLLACVGVAVAVWASRRRR
jgi:autotransporter-associated beta strand protein